MKLFEYQGKELFEKYGIATPKREVVAEVPTSTQLAFPLMVKAQVLSGDRKREGGILKAQTMQECIEAIITLLGKTISSERVETVMLEEQVDPSTEYYLSFTYDPSKRGPIFAVSAKGGSGIATANIFPIDVLEVMHPFFIRNCLAKAGIPSKDLVGLSTIALNLWKLFQEEKVIVAEINPVMRGREGTLVAADAKVDYGKRRTVEHMGGDIAVIASGGGASLLNMDALLAAGGKPANYTEYSGNPPRDVVRDLTKQVFAQTDIKGCWVIGGTANFTDIFETMSGFVEALKDLTPKPTIPFVIRRGGPRQAEAIDMLRTFAKDNGFEFYVYGSDTPMIKTAEYIVNRVYKQMIPPV